MFGTIITVLVKYWVEFLCGSLVGIGGYFSKKIWKKIQQEQELKKQVEQKNLLALISQQQAGTINEIMTTINADREKSQRDDAVLQGEITEMGKAIGNLTAGLLSVQGKAFKDKCRELLDENHTITLEEWEEIQTDHRAYNGLGGNHIGDSLFALVDEKVTHTFTEVK